MSAEKIGRFAFDILGAKAAYSVVTRKGCCKQASGNDILTIAQGIVACTVGYFAADWAFDKLVGEYKARKEDKNE